MLCRAGLGLRAGARLGANVRRFSASPVVANRFLKKIEQGPVICAEGYLFELERRGFVQIGPFVPEIVLNDPNEVIALHTEFARAGSDIIEAFTYYGNRAKMRLIGKEHLLEPLNKQALAIAKQVAKAEGDLLVAGNVCNTTMWVDGDAEAMGECRKMFDEQVQWAAEAGVDLIIGETFETAGEAIAATEAIKRVGLPSVITFAVHRSGVLSCGTSPADACKMVKDAGAAVVGLNCARGPATILPLVREVRKAVPGPIAALPVIYRTTPENPTFQSLSSLERKYQDLDPFVCTRFDVAEFTKEALEAGVTYLGVCCGGAPHHVRAMAMAMGRQPPSSKFAPDLSKHFVFGNEKGLQGNARKGYLGLKDKF